MMFNISSETLKNCKTQSCSNGSKNKKSVLWICCQ